MLELRDFIPKLAIKLPVKIKLPPTRVLPIVGLDVGAMSFIWFVSFGSGLTFAIWLFVFIFTRKFFNLASAAGAEVFQIPPQRQAAIVRQNCPALHKNPARVLRYDATLVTPTPSILPNGSGFTQ